MQQKVEMTPQALNQALTQMKKQANQIDGEAIALRNEATLQIFQNVAQMLNQLFTTKAGIEKELNETKQTLENIFRGHPDIKIALDKEAKEKTVPKIKGK